MSSVSPHCNSPTDHSLEKTCSHHVIDFVGYEFMYFYQYLMLFFFLSGYEDANHSSGIVSIMLGTNNDQQFTGFF